MMGKKLAKIKKRIEERDIQTFYSDIDKFNRDIRNADEELLQYSNRFGNACRICLYTNDKHEFFTVLDEILKGLYGVHRGLGRYKDIKEEYKKISNHGNEILIDCKNFVEQERIGKQKKNRDYDLILEYLVTAMFTTSDIIRINEKVNSMFLDLSDIIGKINAISAIIEKIYETGDLTPKEIKYLETIKEENIRRYIR